MDDLHEMRRLRDYVPEPSQDELDEQWRRIAAETVDATPTSKQRHGLRLPRRVWIPAVAAALTGALVLSVTLLRDTTGSPNPADDPAEPADSSPSQILTEAADQLEADATGQLATPQLDQWRYHKVHRVHPSGGQSEQEDWLRGDFEVLARSEGGEIVTSDAEGQGHAEADFVTDLPALYAFFDSLPDNDPAAVLDRVYTIVDEYDVQDVSFFCKTDDNCDAEVRKEPWNRDAGAFNVIYRLLYIGAPPADVQAKLFRALAEIPGVQDEGTVDDTTGNDALAVSWRPPFDEHPDIEVDSTTYILIDPETSTYRGVLGFAKYPQPSLHNPGGTIVLDTGIVNEPGQLP